VIVVDTTVLVYAVGADHPLRDPCRSLIAAIGDGRIDAATTVEVIQEFAHVRAGRRGRHDASQLARQFAVLLSPLLQPGERDVADGLALFARSEALGAFDSVLAASTINDERATTLVSADGAFAGVDGLRAVDPRSDEVARLLA
jgi:predicted nucleic acid-binding protein